MSVVRPPKEGAGVLESTLAGTAAPVDNIVSTCAGVLEDTTAGTTSLVDSKASAGIVVLEGMAAGTATPTDDKTLVGAVVLAVSASLTPGALPPILIFDISKVHHSNTLLYFEHPERSKTHVELVSVIFDSQFLTPPGTIFSGSGPSNNSILLYSLLHVANAFFCGLHLCACIDLSSSTCSALKHSDTPACSKSQPFGTKSRTE
mmetsp:Transcript_10559/g.14382  ORF Transcript_10559/g.14382 Transcript_10559/m.14382 type:complete len:204 (-) Transcript_10559:994-1605(-)